MNTILRLHNLKTELAEHQKAAEKNVKQKLFHTAKHECEVCININKKIQIIINKERIEL